MYTLNLTKQEFARLTITMEQSAEEKRDAAARAQQNNDSESAAIYQDAAKQCDRILKALNKAEADADPLAPTGINQTHDYGSNDGQPIDDHCRWCGTPWHERFATLCRYNATCYHKK